MPKVPLCSICAYPTNCHQPCRPVEGCRQSVQSTTRGFTWAGAGALTCVPSPPRSQEWTAADVDAHSAHVSLSNRVNCPLAELRNSGDSFCINAFIPQAFITWAALSGFVLKRYTLNKTQSVPWWRSQAGRVQPMGVYFSLTQASISHSVGRHTSIRNADSKAPPQAY